MTTIERLPIDDQLERDCGGTDSFRTPEDDLDLDRVVWDEDYRHSVMQVLNGHAAG